MKPIIVHNSPMRIAQLMLLNIGFMVVAVWLVTTGQTQKELVAGWIGLVVFGIFFILNLKMAFYRNHLVKIDENGVDMMNYGFIPWDDIKSLQDYNGLLVFSVDNEKRYVERLSTLDKMFAALNRKFGFSSVYLPLTCCPKDKKVVIAQTIADRLQKQNKLI